MEVISHCIQIIKQASGSFKELPEIKIELNKGMGELYHNHLETHKQKKMNGNAILSCLLSIFDIPDFMLSFIFNTKAR